MHPHDSNEQLAKTKRMGHLRRHGLLWGAVFVASYSGFLWYMQPTHPDPTPAVQSTLALPQSVNAQPAPNDSAVDAQQRMQVTYDSSLIAHADLPELTADEFSAFAQTSMDALTADDDSIRLAAIQALSNVPASIAIATLSEVVHNGQSAQERLDAIDVLATLAYQRNSNRAVREVLESVMQNSDSQVAARARDVYRKIPS